VKTPPEQNLQLAIESIFLNYVHDNPVLNRLASEQCDYIYSSAKDYQEYKG